MFTLIGSAVPGVATRMNFCGQLCGCIKLLEIPLTSHMPNTQNGYSGNTDVLSWDSKIAGVKLLLAKVNFQFLYQINTYIPMILIF